MDTVLEYFRISAIVNTLPYKERKPFVIISKQKKPPAKKRGGTIDINKKITII